MERRGGSPPPPPPPQRFNVWVGEDFAGLSQYCHLVAGVVGEVHARIFGQTDEAPTAYAHKLGLAFQMTNILRDVGEAPLRGRIYLPLGAQPLFGVKALAPNPT